MWYSTDQLSTLPVCVHTLLVCSPVSLLSFLLPSPDGYATCTSEYRPEFFVVDTRLLVLIFCPQLLALSALSDSQLFVVIFFFTETCNHTITNNQPINWLAITQSL